MNKTSIAWTTLSWNPVTGCDKCSPECLNCYAESMAKRLHGMGNPRYVNGFKVTLHPEALLEPLKLQGTENNMVFVCSMSDLFHKDVPFQFIDKIFDVIRTVPEVIFQILTKRAERMAEYFETRQVPDNAWIGVTCGHTKSLDRVNILKTIDAPVRWISVEPLIEDISSELDVTGIDWVVVGGESGPGARKMEEEWAWNLKVKCDDAHVPFFFKQVGSIGYDGKRRSKSANGCLIHGHEYKEYPLPKVTLAN